MTNLRAPRNHSITYFTVEHAHVDAIVMGIMTARTRRTAHS